MAVKEQKHAVSGECESALNPRALTQTQCVTCAAPAVDTRQLVWNRATSCATDPRTRHNNGDDGSQEQKTRDLVEYCLETDVGFGKTSGGVRFQREMIGSMMKTKPTSTRVRSVPKGQDVRYVSTADRLT